MKKITISIVSLALSALPVVAENAPPSDAKTMEANLNAVLRQFSSRIDVLEQRLRSLEDVPEVKIPRGIRAQLMQIERALEVYCFEQKVTGCQLSDLVGPDKLLRPLVSFDGESYEHLSLRLNGPEWKVTTVHGLSIAYKLHTTDPKLIEGFKKGPNQ